MLARNPSWYGRPARLDRVVLQVTPDPAAQLRALLAGQVQVIAPYTQAGMTDQLAGATGVDYFAGSGLSWDRIDLNLRTPALRQRALRQALFTAIDLARVRTIGAEVFGGAEPMGSHIFVPGQPGYRDQLTGTGQGSGDLAGRAPDPHRGRLHRDRVGADRPGRGPGPDAARGVRRDQPGPSAGRRVRRRGGRRTRADRRHRPRSRPASTATR